MPLPEVDDTTVRKAQRGDSRAFALIVDAYQGPIFNYVLRLVRERTLAEDLTQEVFLRAFQTLPGFSFRSKFSTWLFRVTKNRVVDELRARERRPHSVELNTVDALSVADPPAEQAETMAVLWQAVDELSLDLKLALLLRDVAGFSYNEIADILETTLTTVKWRIYKAREEVQFALEREGIRPTTGADVRSVTASEGR